MVVRLVQSSTGEKRRALGELDRNLLACCLTTTCTVSCRWDDAGIAAKAYLWRGEHLGFRLSLVHVEIRSCDIVLTFTLTIDLLHHRPSPFLAYVADQEGPT